MHAPSFILDKNALSFQPIRGAKETITEVSQIKSIIVPMVRNVR
jgi:hypothetical protein